MNRPGQQCANCGALLPADARFCENCGRPVAAPLIAQPAFPAPRPQSQPAKQPGSKTWLIIAIAGAALVGFLGCALIGGLILWRGLRQPDASTQAANLPPATQAALLPADATATSQPLPTRAPQATETPPELPSPAPSDTPIPSTPASQLTSYDFDGVTFTYDPSLSAAVDPESIAAQSGADLPPWEVYPQHRRLTFLGYPLADTFHQPRLYIYPLVEYVNMDAGISDQLANLQQMLVGRSTTNLPDTLPFFLNWNAGQVMATRVKFLDFKNGYGVRYLAQYGQGVYPINNQAMFYTFQGYTRDRLWLVAAVFPVSNPILPDPEPLLQDPSFFDTYSTYLAEVKAQLDAQPDASFEPDLAILDALIESLVIK